MPLNSKSAPKNVPDARKSTAMAEGEPDLSSLNVTGLASRCRVKRCDADGENDTAVMTQAMPATIRVGDGEKDGDMTGTMASS